MFGLFVLHLSSNDEPSKRLTIWQCTDGTDKKWFKPRNASAKLELHNFKFSSIAIEPSNLLKIWPKLSNEEGRFSPDIVIKTWKDNDKEHFIIIENKGSGARLRVNQLENYPRLMKWLNDNKVSFDFLLLQSIGNDNLLFEQAQKLQKEYTQFGILLWEDALNMMKKTNFVPQGLPTPSWQSYAKGLEIDCDKD